MRVCARLRSADLAVSDIRTAKRARHDLPETKKNQRSVDGISSCTIGRIVWDGGKPVLQSSKAFINLHEGTGFGLGWQNRLLPYCCTAASEHLRKTDVAGDLVQLLHYPRDCSIGLTVRIR
jgi:hypothetical protein